MITLKTKKNKLSYSFVVLSKKKTPNSGKIIKRLGNFNSKIIRLDFNTLAFWLSKNVQVTSKFNSFFNFYTRPRVTLKYKF